MARGGRPDRDDHVPLDARHHRVGGGRRRRARRPSAGFSSTSSRDRGISLGAGRPGSRIGVQGARRHGRPAGDGRARARAAISRRGPGPDAWRASPGGRRRRAPRRRSPPEIDPDLELGRHRAVRRPTRGLPVLVKGILSPEDARLAAEHGAGGDGRLQPRRPPARHRARSAPTRCRRGRGGRRTGSRCSSTAASAAAPTSPRRWRSGASRGDGRPAGCCGDWPSTAPTGSAHVLEILLDGVRSRPSRCSACRGRATSIATVLAP